MAGAESMNGGFWGMRLKNKDIAEKLGISTTAVSLAINNRPGVSEETRRKVLGIINENANSNLQKVQLEEYRHGVILLCVHKKNGEIINDKPFFMQIAGSIQEEAMKAGYVVMLANYSESTDEEQYFNYIRDIRADGVIVLATEMSVEDVSLYKKIGKPVVFLDSSFDTEQVDCVDLDNENAMLRSVAYAYRMGHRDIGYLIGKPRIWNFIHHYDGYRKGLREFHIEKYNHPEIELSCSIEGAYQDMKEFLNSRSENFRMPTLFLADLDYLAIGAMRALKEAGYNIPEDISFIGYDDVTACEIITPRLTSTRVSQATCSAVAVAMLRTRLEEEDVGKGFSVRTSVSSELIIRDSVRKLSV